jgi:hypothetical protein
MLDFISDITRRASSRKFIVLVISVVLFLLHPKDFTGDNLVFVFSVFMGFNVVEKFVDKMK